MSLVDEKIDIEDQYPSHRSYHLLPSTCGPGQTSTVRGQRPRHRHRLREFATVSLFCAFAFLFWMYKDPFTSAPQSTENVCLDPLCVIAASTIIENMSPRHKEIDPCENFDQFACDGFNDKHDIRSDQTGVMTPSIMMEQSQLLLRHLLEDTLATDIFDRADLDDDELTLLKTLQADYTACMNETLLSVIGVQPLSQMLNHITDILSGKVESHTKSSLSLADQGVVEYVPGHLSHALAYLNKLGLSALITFDVAPDDKDPDSAILFLTAPRSPGLPSKQYYEDDKLVNKYQRMILDVLAGIYSQSGLEISSQELQRLVTSLVKLESKLAAATPNTEDAESVTYYYNPYSPSNAQSMLPRIHLDTIISKLAPDAPDLEKIIIGSPGYVKALSAFIEEEEAEVIRTYLHWKAIQALGSYIESPATEPLRRFDNELKGKKGDAKEERWRTCVRGADADLGWILSRVFIQKAFSHSSKDLGNQIVSDIKSVFIEKLEKLEWMSEQVKKLGAAKVRAIVQKIGYPDHSPNILNATALLQYYESVEIKADAYYQNALSASEFDTRRRWSVLGRQVDRAEWGMTADTVNAYYNPPGNEIVFPAGIMQRPIFYSPLVPPYLSYGAFGAVSGHELSHAFDSLGRHYDVNGNYTDWWDNKTVDAFENKAQCFVDQYSKFSVPNADGSRLHVNGKLTLGENIADSGGLNAAFAAWQKLEQKSSSPSLPGLQEFSKEQVFFMSYATFWCGKIRPEAAVQYIYRDPHSPTWARILGTLANSRDFRKSFDCPVKEPTCELW